MKKRTIVLLCAVLATTLLAACASGAADSAQPAGIMRISGETGTSAPQMQASLNMSSELADHAGGDLENNTSMQFRAGSDAAGSGIAGITAPVVEGFAEKIIYSVFANIETVKFDETIAGVNALIVAYNAFIENSSISGQNLASQFYGWTDYRTAHFSIRVPKENLTAMTGRLDDLGNVLHVSSNATNITSQFIDTQSRLNSLSVEEEQLLVLLSKADDVPDLIMIHERLSHIRYQIESLTSTLKNWQNQVDYSTITLSITEVEHYTERVEIHRSYWQQIGDGFMSTMRSVGRFFMNFFKWLIVSAPVLVILAVIAIATLIIVRKKLKSLAKKKANAPKSPPLYQYPPAYGQNYAAPPQEPQSPENDKEGSE